MGYCYAHPWRTRAAFLHTLETSVYLCHEAKHHGIGTQMVRHLIDLCKSQVIIPSSLALRMKTRIVVLSMNVLGSSRLHIMNRLAGNLIDGWVSMILS